jgi:hypothetical protein
MFDLTKFLRWNEARRPDRQKLVSFCIDELNSRYCEELVTKQLGDCATVVKAKGDLFRWRRLNNSTVLVIWDKDSKQFINFDNSAFCQYLGSNFDLQDRSGCHFGLPAAPTAARIWDALLQNSVDLPFADWKLTAERRRAEK